MSSDLLWPAEPYLPCFRFEPYSVAPRSGALQLDIGIHSHRARIYTQNNEVFSVEMILTLSQEQNLLGFYKDDTAYGTQSFLVPVWVNSELVTWECSFIGAPPNSVPVAHEVVRTQFQILGRTVDLSACPILGAPVGTVDNVEAVTLDWSSVVGATSYQVFFWEDGDSEPLTPTYTTTDTEQAVTGLDAETTYHWRVTPVNAAGPTESCGEATFTTSLPQCPELQIPVEGSAVGEETSTTLLWTASPEAVSYQVFVWEDGDPMPGSPTATTSDLTYEVTGLTINTDYHWVVLAVTGGGFVSSGCGDGTFSTDDADPEIQWQSAAFTGDILQPSVTLTVVRSGSTAGSASADYDFTEGTALIGPDFVATPGTVTFAPGEVSKDVVVPLVRDYDAEVLADTPYAYIKMNDADAGTGVFDDFSGNSRDFATTSGEGFFSYQQPTLNLSASLSARVPTGTASNVTVLRDWPNPPSMANSQDMSYCGWARFDNELSSTDRVLCMIGGSGGAANTLRGQFYRAGSDGTLRIFWQAFNPSGTVTNHTVTCSTPCPALGEEFWWCWSQDVDTGHKIRINDGAIETISFGGFPPYQIPSSSSTRRTYLLIGSSLTTGYRARAVGGRISQVEIYDSVQTPERWTRWNLNASLSFTATLSNPVGAALGAIDVTTMTIEA